MRYGEIKNEAYKIEHVEVFYAFSNEQFEEGMKIIPAGEEVFKGFVGGQFGTKKGLFKLMSDLEENDEKIRAECTPQEIYNYEYDNHECGYTEDDSEALEIVECYFPNAKIKRRTD